MSHFSLRCTACGTDHEADMMTLECSECASPLDVRYADPAEASKGPQPSSWLGPAIPLPLHSAKSLVSLGEGNTPVVALSAVGRRLGLSHLFAKLEYLGPTGSFKDRGSSIMLSVAKEMGVAQVVEDSSGNAGASVSAYAARSGTKAHIFAPADAPEPKMAQIRVYGAQAHAIEGPRQAATDAAIEYYSARGIVYASHNLSPYFLEGTKTFAYEVVRQFPDGPPEHIILPVGNGSLLIGSWKGFTELRRGGHVQTVPRHHSIQARAVMPLVAAYRGESWTPDAARRTIAGGIAVAVPPRMAQALSVLRESGGSAVAVEEEDIVRWHGLLAREEGIYAEPTSAAAFAGLERMVADRTIGSSDLVLVAVTGSGLKDAPPA